MGTWLYAQWQPAPPTEGESPTDTGVKHNLWQVTDRSLSNADPEKTPRRPGLRVKLRNKKINKTLDHEGDRLQFQSN